jgi:hypothetical protein
VSFRSSPFSIRRHAPRLGEHTAEVMREVGLDLEVTVRPHTERASDPDV